MNIYCVHWNKLVDRKKSIIDQFGKDVIFVDKYDRRDVESPSKLLDTFPEMKPWINPDYVKDADGVFRACNAMSHVHCFKQVAEGDEEWGVVLEDDSIKSLPHMNFEKHVKELIKKAPPHWDLLCINDGICAPGMLPKLLIGAYDRHWLRLAEPRQSSGYIVSRNGAKKILDLVSDGNAIQGYPESYLDNTLAKSIISITFKSNPWNLPDQWLQKHRDKEFFIWWTIRPLLHDGSHWEAFEKTH